MKTRAFTIVEVMVVLAIGAVFLGIGIPAFRALMGYKEEPPWSRPLVMWRIFAERLE